MPCSADWQSSIRAEDRGVAAWKSNPIRQIELLIARRVVFWRIASAGAAFATVQLAFFRDVEDMLNLRFNGLLKSDERADCAALRLLVQIVEVPASFEVESEAVQCVEAPCPGDDTGGPESQSPKIQGTSPLAPNDCQVREIGQPDESRSPTTRDCADREVGAHGRDRSLYRAREAWCARLVQLNKWRDKIGNERWRSKRLTYQAQRAFESEGTCAARLEGWDEPDTSAGGAES
jgi:hypothetical protein